jgi:hypothetical protein
VAFDCIILRYAVPTILMHLILDPLVSLILSSPDSGQGARRILFLSGKTGFIVIGFCDHDPSLQFAFRVYLDLF